MSPARSELRKAEIMATWSRRARSSAPGWAFGVGPDAVDLLRQLLDRLDEACVAAKRVEGPVKIEVAIKDGQEIALVDRAAVPFLNVFELLDIPPVDGKRHDADCHDLQFFAHRVDFRHFPWREIAHHGAAVRYALDDPLLLQFEEGKAHIGTMRVEGVAKLLFDEALARMTPPEHDLFLEPRGDELRDRGATRAALRGRLPTRASSARSPRTSPACLLAGRERSSFFVVLLFGVPRRGHTLSEPE